MNYKNGDKVVTTGHIPHDNTKCVKAGLKGVVIGRDTDGKYKVAIDGEAEPWYLAEHEIKWAEFTFDSVKKYAAEALKGTAFEGWHLAEYGGGDDEEDIKPFLIVKRDGIELGVTGFPEGGLLFWVWEDEGEQKEFEKAEDAISAWREALGKPHKKGKKIA